MASPLVLWFSKANWLAAASIWRRLLMQIPTGVPLSARGVTKLGAAIKTKRKTAKTEAVIPRNFLKGQEDFLRPFIFLKHQPRAFVAPIFPEIFLAFQKISGNHGFSFCCFPFGFDCC